jgi:hypothetical protein
VQFFDWFSFIIFVQWIYNMDSQLLHIPEVHAPWFINMSRDYDLNPHENNHKVTIKEWNLISIITRKKYHSAFRNIVVIESHCELIYYGQTFKRIFVGKNIHLHVSRSHITYLFFSV